MKIDKRATPLGPTTSTALLALSAIASVDAMANAAGVRPNKRPRETIDDVLARARRDQGPAFNLKLDGRKQGPNEVEDLVERFGRQR